LTSPRKPRPPVDSKDRRRAKKAPSMTYAPTPGPLLQRGNYSLLRILSILNSAGADGLTTMVLLEQLGSKADRITAIIRTAQEMKLIERIPGESEHGQFPPICNKITERGKQLLQNNLSFY
jgi:DNA-binding MarR family transcriptional regulator